MQYLCTAYTPDHETLLYYLLLAAVAGREVARSLCAMNSHLLTFNYNPKSEPAPTIFARSELQKHCPSDRDIMKLPS